MHRHTDAFNEFISLPATAGSIWGALGNWGGRRVREGRRPPSRARYGADLLQTQAYGKGFPRGGRGRGGGVQGGGRRGGSQPSPFRADFIETQHYGERLRVWAVGDPAPGRGEGSVDMGHCLMLRSWRRCDVL